MLKFWTKKKASAASAGNLTWSTEATQGLQQALAQAPVPALLKNRVKSELSAAAEAAARQAGHTEVTAQDLMQGLLAKLPPAMRGKVEEAMKSGPEGIKKLEKDLKST